MQHPENETDFGATAVNAAEIERQIAETAQLAPTHDTLTSPEQIEQHLVAVVRELSALRSSLQTDQPPVQRRQNEPQGTEEDPQPGGILINDSLHEAVTKERIVGLEQQRTNLEQQLLATGRPLPILKEASPPLDPTANTKSSKKRATKKKGQPATELQEDDLFQQQPGVTGLVETERDRLIRMGVLTPFDALGGFERRLEHNSNVSEPPHDAKLAASLSRFTQRVKESRAARPTTVLMHPEDLPKPERMNRKRSEGFWRASSSQHAPVVKRKRRSTLPRTQRKRRLAKTRLSGGDDEDGGSDEEYDDGENSEEEEEEDDDLYIIDEEEDEEALDIQGDYDDADNALFAERQAALQQKHRRLRKKKQHDAELEDNDETQQHEEAPEEEDAVFEGGFRVPGHIYARLFDYQRTGVKWMWELHTQRAGGIIGDEMGLGKTVQVTAFLAGLHHSGKFKPSLIVCPATILKQWLRELRSWYPFFRVAILHDSLGGKRGNQSVQDLVQDIASSDCGILLTTYDQLRLKSELVLNVRWGYAILDEGHKIRNPEAAVTLKAKQLATWHRLIMTGSPIQNKLSELWSLFDFVFPGKLGTLPVFETQFEIPIRLGSYANATALSVNIAHKCAVLLRDLVSPYLLRRRKADVASSLPKKTERVLFCMLTPEQRDMYRSYLDSKELQDILGGNRPALAGIDVLRKICNHPDLMERQKWAGSDEYGNPRRSGKLQVLEKVLTHWKEYGHKALVFTQTQQMLDILEDLVQKKGWSYHRMDGSTAVSQRSKLVDDFNTNDQVFCFLLTTRVGGLGVNLTGANRCVIFDPDWNPSTDVQARERAWRVGQTREVTVYRLITSGTIEEKVYHRQVYKQFLTERVLKDPRQRAYFKDREMRDLFTLGEEYADGTETAEIFARLNGEITAQDLEEPPDQQQQQQQDSDRDDYVSEQGDGTMEDALQRNGSVSKIDITAGPSNGTDDHHPNDDNGGMMGEMGILKELLAGSGVQSALDHDVIENAHAPEQVQAEREAARIASRAAEMLRQSREACRLAPVNQPTWTGRFGSAGAPNQMPRFGKVVNNRLQANAQLSSADILARIKERQQPMHHLAPELQRAQSLAERVVAFLQRNGGSSPTDVLIGNFQNLPPSDVPLFKRVLKQVATLNKQRGVWTLNGEFADDIANGSV